MDIQIITLISVALIATVILYFQWCFTYWSRRNVVYLKPSIPLGNMYNTVFGTTPFAYLFQNLYKKFNNVHKYAGFYIFTKPVLVIFDLNLIKYVLINDFEHFENRSFYIDKENDPLSANIFALKGKEWKNLREKLSIVFTPSKLKMLFSTIEDVADQLVTVIDKSVERCNTIEIKDVAMKYATDLIGSFGFGVEFNSLKHKQSKFQKFGNEIIGRKMLFRSLHLNIFALAPNVLKKLRIKFVPSQISNCFINLVDDVIRYREKNNVFRKDVMQIMMEMKNKNDSNNSGFTITEITAHLVLFFVAGFHAPSLAVTTTLLEFAANETIQNRVRTEIDTVLKKYNYKICYDSLQEMTYMDSCIKEGLRLYAPLANLFRECTQDYKVPDSDLIIEKGTLVFIPITDIHHDPEIYHEPHVFNPDRFYNKDSYRHISTWMPFGEGPRVCIGRKLGLIQVKIALVKILKDFQVSLDPRTKYPPTIDPGDFLVDIYGDVWLNVKRITVNNSM